MVTQEGKSWNLLSTYLPHNYINVYKYVRTCVAPLKPGGRDDAFDKINAKNYTRLVGLFYVKMNPGPCSRIILP